MINMINTINTSLAPRTRSSVAPADTVVVGGGVGGLLTAALLARAGQRVVIVDKAVVGGRAKSIELAGVPVNPGPRAIIRGGAFDRALRDLGVRPAGFRPPTSGGLAFCDGALHALPASPVGLVSTTLLHGAARKEAALALARITVGALDVAVVDGVGESFDGWLSRHARSPEARRLIAALARVATYAPIGFGPGTVDAVADGAAGVDAGSVLQAMRRAFVSGVTYVDGGWSAVVASLVEVAVAAGVVIVDDDAVVSVEEGGVVGNSGSVYVGSRVVVAGSPEVARTLLGRPTTAEPVVASCLDLVLAYLPEPRRRFVLGLDAPLYFSVHTRPSQHTPVVVHVARYGGGASRDDLEAFVDAVQPGWRELVRGARFLPKMTVMHDLPRSNIAADVCVSDRSFVVGDFCGRGFIADAVADSAVAVVDAIVGSTAKAKAA